MSSKPGRFNQRLINELQTHGVRLSDPAAGAPSRRGGAGPSDHKAVEIGGKVVMIPVHTAGAGASPMSWTANGSPGVARRSRAWPSPTGRASTT